MPFTKHTLLAIAATLISLSATLALPAAVPATANTLQARGVTPNTQSCTATDHVFWASYSTDIGVNYNGGSGCNAVFDALNSRTAITNWQCVDDGAGGTQLWFNAPVGHGGEINDGLLSTYPWVGGQFNCPDS
ncbi:hypothetical protein LTR09_009305 [Extremus antarcticus]|uniref:Uncharacterized protein n=1 Tax=Extremus antarcticus TaxID=702011 RepID=A0AAJ0D8Y4_9PEZI|nr:hypothetical protein LTR09_009305 [Extremus antarcticus]